MSGYTAAALRIVVVLAAVGAATALGAPTELEQRIARMEAELGELRELASSLKQTEATLEETSRRQEILTGEVRRLRDERELPEETPDEGEHGMSAAASRVYGNNLGFAIGGYGQGWYRKRVSDKGKTRDDFDLKRFVLYTGYKFSDRVMMNAELEWEHANAELSVEFAQLDFLLRDPINIRAGLLLVPVGFLNTLHEPTTYHGNERPEVELRLIPTTWRENGAGIFGKIGDRFEYQAYVVESLRASRFSSAGVRSGRQKGSAALAEHLSFVLRGDWQASERLELGASLYTGRQGQGEDLVVGPGGARARPDVDMTLLELHGRYRHRGLELRALGTWTRLDDALVLSQAEALAGRGPVAERMRGGYLEVAYDLMRHLDPASTRSLEVFFRYEDLDTQDRVPLGFVADASRDVRVRTWGIDFKPIPEVVLKLDYRNLGQGAGAAADEVNLGFGWTF